MLENPKIAKVVKADGLVAVTCTADGFGPCNFVFAERNIACFGDIDSFVWNTTWNAAEEILKGNCYASQPRYLMGKLEHKAELKRFSYEAFLSRLNELKRELMEDMDDEGEREEFSSQWDSDVEYDLSEDEMDGMHLGKFDDFAKSYGIDDCWECYDDFFVLPTHYDIAIEFLRFIEEGMGKTQ